ncbi:Dual-specificity kinase, spindle pole body (SPB) duplication and spindle checkpoint function [Coemansia sp. RSA 989]|nr:Dual-specificity kinase, spindle pole body (SPB) duplication and spindle checkpoint function [Coemansia sp. RSA 1086]KAJ1747915.1 Dual-specificity kinase, spindle pole body (SPB) duplication and spindle checkpoint function [Coemansia sp. RSA 1821]KAJ1862016.1 Dual-specificity kinase, spindle pole body (SPB) duplication and spindle checkpoint function [Coemansia sp. RSA 989]KAJ1869927.1 Dual-specificity kinase, spindle pole body (SPB) duplication and spindle checkpoint function [Coemansia sp. 
MSLYSFDSSHREQPSSTSHYTTIAGSKKSRTKLFDLSMEDFDDLDNMSDLENLDFGKLSNRASALSRPTYNSSFQLISPPQQEEQVRQRDARSLSFDGNTRDSQPSAFGLPQSTEPRDRGRQGASHLTLATDREQKQLLSPQNAPSLLSGTSVDFQEPLKQHTPAAYRMPATSDITEEPKTANLSRLNQPSEVSETPAYRPPVHPKTQGSTVTTRWKRRGRLGLAKPKRFDAAASEDNSVEIDSSNAGPSPADSLEFMGNSSGSVDQRLGEMRFAERSYASGFGSIESIDKRSSVVSLDEAVAHDVEHTFQGSRARMAARSSGLTESQEAPLGTSTVAAPGSYEAKAHMRTAETSDVSMNSNSQSRPQSPEPGSTAWAPMSEVKGILAPNSAGRRVDTKPMAISKDSKEEPASMRRAMSPPHSRQRPPIQSPEHASPAATDMAGSPKLWNHSQSRHQSPRQQALGRSGASTAIKQEARLSAFGDPGPLDISTRFQQYEKRINDAASSPQQQFKSPRERQRLLAGAFQTPGQGLDTSSPENREDSRHSADGRGSGQRHHTSSSMRSMDWRSSPSDQPQPKARQPEERHYSSPRLSARRNYGDDNFDALRASTPRAAAQPEPMQVDSNSGISSAKSDDRNHSAAVAKPTEEKAILNDHYASAAAQVVQQHKKQVKFSAAVADTPMQSTPSPQDQSVSQPPSSQPPQQQARNGIDPKRMLSVNNRPYQKISITGRGGSSKVYKAMSAKHEIFAIKRVSFSRADVQAIEGYVNEIILLRKFEGNPHIVQLFDAEINKERGLLHMVMEFGETDLASVLKRSGNQPLGMNTIRLYWEQMLRAVQTIHEERVVHADLKPANYLLVKGSLKLIDFGIAKAIGNDTTNIHRENQIGTVNYMSPEAIKETNTDNGKRLMKLGRASDIWSLGIILYQMCYGHTPFSKLALFKKLASIPDPSFVIPYPPYMAGCLQVGTDRDPNNDTGPKYPDGTDKVPVPSDLLRAMRTCLQRDPAKRMTIPELLVDPLLCPISFDQALPSAMSQMLTLLKQNPHVLDQWDVSKSQNESLLASLVQTLHQQESNK